jgi:hypothetical protein
MSRLFFMRDLSPANGWFMAGFQATGTNFAELNNTRPAMVC